MLRGVRSVILQVVAVCLILLVSLVQGCASSRDTTEPSSTLSEIVKSPNDEREYRHLVLENGLDVLLISDPEEDKAAAALDVYVGNYQSPEGREGLPHFLEHMLFLGTEKYPDPAGYDQFIDQHGGSKNAYTGHENTNYFFQVDGGHLEEALDRFSQFFIAPLFNAEYVNREKHAVESEYQLHIKNDAWRHRFVLREQVSPEHPFSKFMVGNLETLGDKTSGSIRDDLINFYKKYYSANLMKLVVLGNTSLDDLQAMVEPRFSKIINHQTAVQIHKQELIESRRLPLQINYIPEQEIRELSLIFQVPKQASHWREKPAQYFGRLIGYEGENSLLALLKEKGWAEGLGVGMAREDRASAQFQIDIALTPESLANQTEIIEATFAWINLIREQGIENWRYEEQARLNDIAFRFKEKQGAMRYVSALASKMQQYPVTDVVHASYLMSNYDSRLIQAFADRLVPENMILMITDPDAKTDRVSKYYGAAYSSQTLSEKNLRAWHNPRSFSTLQLPVRNPFIPENLSLKGGKTSAELPQLLPQDGDSVDVWHLLDNRFGVPRGHIIARLESEKISSIQGRVLADLYSEYVRDSLNAQAYPAQEAGLSYSLAANSRGLSLLVGGYSDKQQVLLGEVLNALANPEWDKARFERVKETMQRDLHNFSREYPFRQLLNGLGAMVRGEWAPGQKVKVLAGVTLDQLETFSSTLIDELSLNVVIIGNHTETEAQQIVDQLTVALKPTAVNEPLRIAKFEAGAEKEGALYVEHPDSALVLYVQGRDDSLAERARMLLLGEMLSSPFYQSLRTEKQLGYVVAAFTNNQNRVTGLTMLVQSPVLDEAGLRREFDLFFQSYKQQVSLITSEDLKRYKASVLSRLQEQPKNLSELSARFVESLNLGYPDFSFRDQIAQAVSDISLDELKQTYLQVLLNERRALWIASTKQKQEESMVDLRQQGKDYQYSF